MASNCQIILWASSIDSNDLRDSDLLEIDGIVGKVPSEGNGRLGRALWMEGSVMRDAIVRGGA